MSAEFSKTRAAIAEVAADWFVRCRDDEFSAAEKKQLADWLRESPVHVEEYLAVARMWGVVPNVPGIEGLSVELPDESAVVQISEHRSADTESLSDSHPSGSGTSVRSRFATAASVLLVAVTAGYFFWASDLSGEQHETARGEQRSLVLTDGTVIELNTESRITVDYSDSVRLVRLESGEAFFDVKEGDSRAFEVVTENASIRVLGTQFNVYRRTTDTTITVVEGKVSVDAGYDLAPTENSGAVASIAEESGRSAVQLEAGEQAVIDDQEQLVMTSALPDTERFTAWTDRRLVFEETDLENILQEFARYNDLSFRLTSREIAALELTGTFDSNDLESFVDYLEFHPAVSVRRDGNLLVIGSVQ